MMQTQIPDGLRTLMQASQLLQQASSPIAQTPVGPRPTVAGAVSQGLQEVAQEKALPQIGQQAGIAGQIQAQRLAQRQQMAQDPQAIAAMAAQMMRPEASGIGSLSADVPMKEGGIIGYNGEEESYVGMTPLADTERTGLQKILEEMDPSDPRYQQTLERLKNIVTQPETFKYAEELKPRIQPVMASEFTRGPGAGADIRTPPQSSDLAKPEASMGPRTGIASALPAPKAPVPVETTAKEIAPPETQKIYDTAKSLFPDAEKNPFWQQITKNSEEREKWLSQQPNLEQAGIRLIEDAARDRTAALQSNKQNDNFRRFMAAMNTIRYGSNDYVKLMDQFEAREAADQAAALKEKEAILKWRQADQARQAGKFDRADALAKQGMDLFKETQKSQAAVFGHIAHLEGGIYGEKMRAETSRVLEASKAKDREEARKQREELAKSTEIQRLRTLIEDIDKAVVTERRKFEETPAAKMAAINMEALKKNPEQYQAYLQAKMDLDARLKNLETSRKMYMDQVQGFPGWGELKISGK